MKKLAVACLTAGLFISIVAAALAATPNYAGSWTLDKSKSGELPRMWQQADSISRTIAQTDKTVAVTDKAGEAGDTMTYNLDGSTSTADVGGRMPGKATLSAKVNGDGSVELTTVREGNFNGNAVKFTITETWALADGGKTLKVHRVSVSPRGTQENNLVFTKS